MYLVEIVLTSCTGQFNIPPYGLTETDLITLGLSIRLEVTVLNEVVPDLRVVPSAPDGRLGPGVVFI